jgi:hypothetical protein
MGHFDGPTEYFPIGRRDIMHSNDRHEMARLAVAANPFQAHIWQQALEQEGIHGRGLGDYLNAGLGDLPSLGAEVWVDAADVARAEIALRQHRDQPEEATEPAECA